MTGEVQFFVENLYDETESWKVDHVAAMECRDLEELLRTGIGLFHVIRLSDESWTRKVQTGSVLFAAPTVRSIRATYEWWLAPCERVLSMLREVEPQYKVEGAEEFRRCYRVANNIAGIDLAGLLESQAQAARGELEPLTQGVWDAVSLQDHA